MILELAAIDIRPGKGADFESTFTEAGKIIAGVPGHISHRLERCIESQDQYVLLVEWETLEDHTIGFRESPQYQKWRSLLHPFFNTAPEVSHFTVVSQSG